MWGAVLGAAGGIAQKLLAGGKEAEEQRRREQEVGEALNQNVANRERILGQSSEANRRAAAGAVQQGMAGALAQAGNVAAGANQAAGLSGGDISSATIAGTKAAGTTMAAAAPYSQQLAGLYSQKASEDAQQNSQLSDNTMQRANISQMTDYIQKPAQAGTDWMGALMSGMNQGSMFQTNTLDTGNQSAELVVDPLTGKRSVKK